MRTKITRWLPRQGVIGNKSPQNKIINVCLFSQQWQHCLCATMATTYKALEQNLWDNKSQITLTVWTTPRRNWTQCNPALNNGKKILMTTKFWLQGGQNSKHKEQHRSVHEHQWFPRISMCPPLHQDQKCFHWTSITIPPARTNISSHSMGQLWPTAFSSIIRSSPAPEWPCTSHPVTCHQINCSHCTVNVIITMGPTAGLGWFFSQRKTSSLQSLWRHWEKQIFGPLSINHCPCHDHDQCCVRMHKN